MRRRLAAGSAVSMRDRLLADAGQLPTIAAGPVALRWITTEDVPALFVVFGDAEVCRYWSRHLARRQTVAAVEGAAFDIQIVADENPNPRPADQAE